MKSRVYCTYFDEAYAPRGRVLIQSLRQQGDMGKVYVLALDDAVAAEVPTWLDPNVELLEIGDLESAFPQLASARADRGRMEFVFTLTPWLTRWVIDRVDDDSWVTYLDADMAFYSSTDPLYDTLTDASVGIVEHRFTWEQAWRRKFGRFNVAWVGFRKNSSGLSCLDWWGERCLEWCRDEVDNGRFADQGYLDRFPELFPGVVVIDLPGADVAPWNLRRYRVSANPDGTVLVNGDPLIFFHFHGLRHSAARYYFKHVPYLAKTTPEVRDLIYRPYCELLDAATPRGSSEAASLERRPTLLRSLRSGRAATLRWLGEQRGDFVDIPNRSRPIG